MPENNRSLPFLVGNLLRGWTGSFAPGALKNHEVLETSQVSQQAQAVFLFVLLYEKLP